MPSSGKATLQSLTPNCACAATFVITLFILVRQLYFTGKSPLAPLHLSTCMLFPAQVKCRLYSQVML